MIRLTRSPLISLGASLVVALGALSACGHGGGSSDSAYCGDLKHFESTMGGDISGAKLESAFSQMHGLNGEAPGAVKQEWSTVDKAITTMEDAFHDAGLELSDLDSLTTGEVPDGVDLEKLQAVMDATKQLQSKPVTDALSAIESDAKDECGLTLQVF